MVQDEANEECECDNKCSCGLCTGSDCHCPSGCRCGCECGSRRNAEKEESGDEDADTSDEG